MAKKSKTKWPVIAAVIFVVAVIAAISLSSFGNAQYKCEVCVTYKGIKNCGTSAGSTREDAERAATEIACSPIASGITEGTQCRQSPDLQVTWK